MTDGEGNFSLSGRITAQSRLTVSAKGFAPFERKLANDGVRDFTIVLQPSQVTADVTVSVTRTETRLSETPASIVVLSRSELDSTAAQTIDDSLRQIAGFTLVSPQFEQDGKSRQRTARTYAVFPAAVLRAPAVVFDGLSLNDAFGGWTYWSRVPQVAVEQAEVLRGGASSFYGTSGLSGAVNLSPVRTDDNASVLRFQASAGSQKTLDGGVFAAYAYKGWVFDLAAETFRTNGYIPTAEYERGLVDTNANSKHNNAIGGIQRRFRSGRVFARGNIFSEDRENGTSLTNNATYFRQASAGGDIVREAFGRFEARGVFAIAGLRSNVLRSVVGSEHGIIDAYPAGSFSGFRRQPFLDPRVRRAHARRVVRIPRGPRVLRRDRIHRRPCDFGQRFRRP